MQFATTYLFWKAIVCFLYSWFISLFDA